MAVLIHEFLEEAISRALRGKVEADAQEEGLQVFLRGWVRVCGDIGV